MAGEDGTTRQHKTLVTDILHRGSHGELGARYEASAVLHIPRVMAGSYYGGVGEGDGEEVAQVELNKSQSSWALCQAANIFMPGSFTL